ncbi:pilus assembly protein N-terminal domain-containing protein [Pannonibacter sp. Pt2-lr]
MRIDGRTANRKEKAMTWRWLAVMLLAGQVAFGALLGAAAPAAAQGFPKSVSIAAGERAGERILRVGLGRSVVVDIAEDVADVLVSEPEIADATVRSRNRIYVVGNKAGQASVVLFGTSGREIASFSVRVEPDTSDLNAIIRKLMPNTDIRADSLNGSVVLTGTAQSTGDAQKAADLAARFWRSPEAAEARRVPPPY